MNLEILVTRLDIFVPTPGCTREVAVTRQGQLNTLAMQLEIVEYSFNIRHRIENSPYATGNIYCLNWKILCTIGYIHIAIEIYSTPNYKFLLCNCIHSLCI